MASRSEDTRHLVVPMPAAGRSGARCGANVDAPAAERRLTRFVRSVVFLERAGNGIGTVAFTWATVVVLGGFSTLLNQQDFLCSTILVFLEAARIFGQNTTMEYQFFFRARGALRRPRLNRVIAIVCMAEVLLFFMSKYENRDTLPILGPLWKEANFQEDLKNYMEGYCEKYKIYCTSFEEYFFQVFVIFFAVVLFTLGKLMYPVALNLFCDPQHRPGSVWSSLAAILLLGPCLFLETSIPKHKLKVPRIIFISLLVVVLLVASSKLQFQRITALVNSPTGRRMISKSPVIIIFCVCTAVAILGNTAGALVNTFLLLALLVETFGNLEVLAAVVRIQYAVMGFIEVPYNYPDGTLQSTKKNFMHSRTIFYRMVLIEGALCILACILETFSSIPRKSLLRQSGFGSKWGVKCVDMYYSCVYNQCIAGGVLAPKITQLTIFAMDFTNSDSASNQLYGVQMLHSFLQREPSKALLLSSLSTSMKTVQTLISMLGWESPQNAAIRLFAAKVINDLANTIQVVAIPRSMQNISSLLGTHNQMKRQSSLLYTYGSQEEGQDTVLDIGDDEEDRQDALVHTSSRRKSRILRSWQWMTCCSTEEELFTDQDLLPVLGMSILERLADCGPENCEELCKANNLIPKIIEYTNDIYDKILKGSSLKLLRRLSTTGGEIGVTLRKKISEQPCLLRNLAEILDDIEGSQELKKLAVEILRNLATDRNTRQEIVHFGVITSRLVHAFLARHPPSNPYSDRSLQIMAGQALALLSMENVNNCSLMLKEPGYLFIRELIIMIQDNRYNRYVAASILRNLCLNARPMLSSSDMAELSRFLRKVLERIMDTEEAGELEVLISLSSQICIIIPGDFARELEHGQIKDRFVKKLVKALNANTKPTAHFPGIRRAIVEQVIYMMELENSSSCANYFSNCQMIEALSMVEKTASKVENYMLFFGNAGLMEHIVPLSDLVARAKKELMHRVP